MEFIGRKEELRRLEKEYSRRTSFVLVTGRRRVGKTRLINEFIAGKDAMYFLVTEQADADVLADFSAALSRYSGKPQGRFDDWRDAMKAFVMSKPGKKILVIDEFQNLFRKNESFLSLMQDVWDGTMSQEELMLIVCGSHVSSMESLDKNRRSPLYGRITRHLVIRPLPFEDVRDGLPYTDEVERYAVLGGIPRYMELFDDVPLRDNVEDNVMNPSSMLFDDPRVLLGDEVREVASYMSIMRAIADGNRKLSDISSAVQVPSTTLNAYLRRLIEMGMVVRRVPVTDCNPSKSRNGLYTISDYYTAFWFRFVFPYSSEIQSGDPSWALSEYDQHFIDKHVSFVFEDLCRAMVPSMSDAIGFKPARVGSYWDGKTEIDVMAINPVLKAVFVAECKYHPNNPVDNHVLNSLKRKVGGIRELDGYKIVYGLFSLSGFDHLDDEDVVLVDRGEVVRICSN